MKSIAQRIALSLDVRENQVVAAINLLDEGATVPFIARYRKEVTGGLSDIHLRDLLGLLTQLRELEARREVVLKSIQEQEKLTPQLERAIQEAESKTVLEDLYLPYRPKRRTKAQIAREAGLAPLAETLFKQPEHHPARLAANYLNPEQGITDVEAALEGAQQILIEQFTEEASLVGQARESLWESGLLHAKVVKGKELEGEKFADYFEFEQPVNRLPSHRILALLRGKEAGILRLSLSHRQDAQAQKGAMPFGALLICRHFKLENHNRPADLWRQSCGVEAWKKRLKPSLDSDLLKRLTELAQAEAVRVFAANLKDLLLSAPAGMVPVMGLDPGLRTGVKVAVVDATGQVQTTATIYPHQPRNDWEGSIKALSLLIKKYKVPLIAIGNGTASRETDRLVAELNRRHPDLKVTAVVVSEAGASVYSASAYASQELPEMDVSLRGAVSIARRLQDPLAELVKIDPKSIGVGQYQHDVDPKQLDQALDGVVEDAVNSVGVDVNTASIPLLQRVSGLNSTLAQNIVAFRDKNGPFANRKGLNKVPRFGAKTFELAAGFLRIQNGDTPLDGSAVHPEAYPLVERIVRQTRTTLPQLMGHPEVLKQLTPKDFVDTQFGEPTIRDILKELEKPGRDPRPSFKTATFQEGVEDIKDLQPGMVLEGVVSNVTNFGAFVDIGVHQDGLVHISAMSNQFVKDPHQVTRAGAVVQVKVMEIDLNRRRIALSMRLEDQPGAEASQATAQSATPHKGGAPTKRPTAPPQAPPDNAMAAAFAKLKQGG
ncbi:RNA binding S1 domain protein [Magnetococcus marinus MC-1]|uniref:RNA binding S1 domain protein n=1 Tax=Magnetococcus marinus (strain ATCC BAA-1437 / JCM 17883 / MC-1) TaxID=156889 RepID=A0L7M6_MAGMM|nr:Tex family protein [Magnetococcus marinus]ABK43969.1 RNA binding S1 domain protein [Magnetococcus marinus MC-1]